MPVATYDKDSGDGDGTNRGPTWDIPIPYMIAVLKDKSGMLMMRQSCKGVTGYNLAYGLRSLSILLLGHHTIDYSVFAMQE